MNNVNLFDECFKHPNKYLNQSTKDILNRFALVATNPKVKKCLKANKALIKLLDGYDGSDACVEKIDVCLKVKGMNMSPFSQYLMVHDVTYDIYEKDLTVPEKKFLIESYVKDRHSMYKKDGYSDTLFQVLSDSYSHKRKGKVGVLKIKKFCESRGLKRLTSANEIANEKYYILPDGGDKKLFEEILAKFNIAFEFRKEHQGKLPDALLKNGNRFWLVEHKLSKGTGGGQDKQMTEIIEFIKYSEKTVGYISFLDGVLFNELEKPNAGNKLSVCREQILGYLAKNANNLFLNEFGFNKFLGTEF